MEVLVSLALLGLAIGLLSKLAVEYNRVLSFADDKDRRIVVAQALESISAAVSEAHEIVEPGLGVSGAERLVLRGVEVNSPSRLPRWSFDPEGPVLLSTYRLEGTDLTRSSNLAGDQVIAREIAGFSASHIRETSIVLQLTIDDRSRLSTFRMEAYRWVR